MLGLAALGLAALGFEPRGRVPAKPLSSLAEVFVTVLRVDPEISEVCPDGSGVDVAKPVAVGTPVSRIGTGLLGLVVAFCVSWFAVAGFALELGRVGSASRVAPSELLDSELRDSAGRSVCKSAVAFAGDVFARFSLELGEFKPGAGGAFVGLIWFDSEAEG